MKKWILLMIALALATVSSAGSAELTILTENLPPLNYVEKGVLTGSSVEIVKEIQRRVGSSDPIQVYPWARAYRMALDEKNVILFGMTHTKDRHDKFKWVGPLAKKRDILVAKKGSGIKINTLEDAKKVKRIGTLRDDTREKLLTSYGFTKLYSVSDEQKNARKLVMGRIDLWAYKSPGVKKVCELAGVNPNELEEVFHLREINLMIAFSNKTSDTIVERWQEAFDEMSKDGTLKIIQEKW